MRANSEILRAWKDACVAVSENEKLPEAKRLAEPYFARAEIWAAVNDYAEAMQDYLTAIRCVRTSGQDVLSYSRYLDKLYEVAEKVRSQPVAPSGAHADTAEASRRQFSEGTSRFFGGDLQAALRCFDNAVQLAPDRPLYWYFRALTHRRLGDHQRALHDVLLGAYFERRYSPLERRLLHRGLSRVQGKDRCWLESYRLGDPLHCLVQTADGAYHIAGAIP